LTASLVSVLLPVRDEASYLEEALESLSAQTFSDFEVLVVDDGSTDGSAEIAEAHGRSDGRFRVVRQDAAGLVTALERVRAEARGPLIARMDGDDVAFPARLEAQVEALGDPDLAACGGRVSYFPEEAVRDGARRYERWLNGLVSVEAAARDVFVECPLPHPTLTIKAHVLASVGGYRECEWPEDYDLVLRLWAAGQQFRNVEAAVLRWREHGARRSRVEPAYAQDAFVRCKVHHLRATLLPRFPGVLVYGAGPVGKSFARELQAQGTEVVAFVDVDPRKIGHDVYGAPVVSLEDAPKYRDAFALGAVAGEVARAEIREAVAAEGRRDGVDFVAVA
jgi:glycosyltransferase involved in cell wall biosynthesis